MTRIAVVGDIHGNARALAAALAAVDDAGCDGVVFLGDVLTYGVDVDETLDLLTARLDRAGAVLLRGNHDVIYDRLLEGTTAFEAYVPDWVRESAEWTAARLRAADWKRLPFRDAHAIGSIAFHHANPYRPRSWDYLNSAADHARAAAELCARGQTIGVFGHTHRIKVYREGPEERRFAEPSAGVCDPEGIHILNAGSIGQPRDTANPEPCILWLEQASGVAAPVFAFQRFEYDVQAHLRGVAASGMSAATAARIAGFFKTAPTGTDAVREH